MCSWQTRLLLCPARLPAMRRMPVRQGGRMAVSRHRSVALRSGQATRRSTPALTRHVQRLLLGALAALAAACPGVAAAAPVTGPVIGATPTMALVSTTGTVPGGRVSYG